MAEKSERLLLLTPNPDGAASLIAIVEELGYALVVVETCEAAHEAVRSKRTALVIVDGRRLDEQTYTVMVRVVRAMTQIIEEGRATGQFEAIDPMLLYLTTIWPIVVYLATAPIRGAVARVAHIDVHRLDAEHFIRHMQTLNRRALMPAAADAGPIGEPS